MLSPFNKSVGSTGTPPIHDGPKKRASKNGSESSSVSQDTFRQLAERAELNRQHERELARERDAVAERVRKAEREDADRVRQEDRAEADRVRREEREETDRVRRTEREEDERRRREDREERDRMHDMRERARVEEARASGTRTRSILTGLSIVSSSLFGYSFQPPSVPMRGR